MECENDLCPKGWAWMIKDCDMLESSCRECMQATCSIEQGQAPIRESVIWGQTNEDIKEDERERIRERVFKALKEARENPSKPLQEILNEIEREYKEMQDILLAIDNWWYGEAQRFKDEDSRITFSYRHFKELREIYRGSVHTPNR